MLAVSPVRRLTEVTFCEMQPEVIAALVQAVAKYCWPSGAFVEGANLTVSSPAFPVANTRTFPGATNVKAGFASIGIETWVDVRTIPRKETEASIETLVVAERFASLNRIGLLTVGVRLEPAPSAGTVHVTVWLAPPDAGVETVQADPLTAVARSVLGTVNATTDDFAAPPKLLSSSDTTEGDAPN